MAVPNIFDPNEVAASAEVNENFAAVVSGAAMENESIQPQHLTPEARGVTGSIVAFAGSSSVVPTGWLICDGSELSRATYADLFAIIGTTYGAPTTSTFRLPDILGKVIVQVAATQTEFNALGKTGGARTHTLTEAEMPPHNHGTNIQPNTANTGPYRGSQGPYSGERTLNTGGGQPHNNLQPYISLNYIIKT